MERGHSKRDRVAAVSKENMLQDVFTRKLNGRRVTRVHRIETERLVLLYVCMCVCILECA